MKTKTYRPRKHGFIWRTILTLLAYGELKNSVIREEIGLNEHSKNSPYSDRSNYHFDIIVDRLMNRGLIERVKRGYYRLTPKGEEGARKLVVEFNNFNC